MGRCWRHRGHVLSKSSRAYRTILASGIAGLLQGASDGLESKDPLAGDE
jgi:hypothetical protein